MRLISFLSLFLFVAIVFSLPLDSLKKNVFTLNCDFCLAELELVDLLLKQNKTDDEILTAATDLCVAAEIEVWVVCHGMIYNEYGPELLKILVQYPLTPHEFCGEIGVCPKKQPLVESVQKIEEKAQKPVEMKTYNKPNNKGTVQTGYFLQLTDIHYDALYAPGTNPDCGMPLCCREGEVNQNGTEKANRWGNYLCDLTTIMLENFLAEIQNSSIKPDFVVWTGDNPPHDIWEQSIEGQLNRSKVLVNYLNKAFPGIPVYPVLGNHESYPSDQYHPPNTTWLSDGLAEYWSVWLNEEQLATVREGLYYTALIKPGLRFISLNTLYPDLLNFYRLLNESNEDNHTTWFHDVLAQAKQNNEQVLIAGHIPCAGNSYIDAGFCADYAHTISEYTDIIVGHIFGHTHHDQFMTLFNPPDSENVDDLVGIFYIAPSLTTYQNINPSYRFYEYQYDSSSSSPYEITDILQYHVNLTEAIISDTPTWSYIYSAKQAYGLSDLSPLSWYNLYKQLQIDDTLLQTYYSNFITLRSDSNCDWECQRVMLCMIKSTNFETQQLCLA